MRRGRRGRAWAWLLALLLAASAPAGAALAKPPIWIVRSPKATLVLFGSIHLLPAGLDWRPAALDKALASADEIWFELPIDAATRTQATTLSLRRGALPRGRRLASMMSADETERLRRAAVSLDCAPDALDLMQPWMADLTLSLADDARAGATASAGVEDEIQALAPATARRKAFETARQQIELLAGSPVKDQIAGLEWTVREVKDDPASYGRVVGEWMRGDLVGLQRDAIVPLVEASPTLYDRLIGARNRRWTRILAKRLKKPGTIVVVVGIAHLVGPRGVPALLRAKGFEVEGPISETPSRPAAAVALGSPH